MSSEDTPPFSENFTHLHLHTVYSLLDGAIRIKDLIQHVKSLNMKSVAITDHGNMFGVMDFYAEAKQHGIKPIIGSEFYVAPGSRLEKKNVDGVKDGQSYHLILLAKNMQGYKNLIKLSSKSYLEGFYRKPRIDYELLAQHSEGLIATSACLAGEINRKILAQKNEEAQEIALHLQDIVGKGNFFLEIQNHGLPEQAIAAKGSYDIHKKTGIPLVLTNDAHFLRRQDRMVQDIMLRIQMNKKIDEPLDFGFNEEFYVKSPQEMWRLFPEIPEAYHNTNLIADMTDLEFAQGQPLLPDFDTPPGMTLHEYLAQLVHQGMTALFPGGISKEYIDRAEYELKVIGDMGFDGYFLIVADFIREAKKNGIPVGPGRGSAAGSLVAYSLGITAIDPLQYDLLFERFLNPSRNEMPDIDIDFCRDRREDVIKYVVDKYGADKVSQIITFGTLSARAVVKDVARVMGFDFSAINSICKNMPDTPGISLEDAVSNSTEAKNFFKSGEKEKTLWEVALALEGVPRNAGKHAAGVVIGPQSLDEIVPLAKDTKTGSVISQFEKNNLEKTGLVKMDFLGLKNLTIIQRALTEIKRRKDIDIDINKIPLDDPAPYQLLQTGKTKGIFQLENTGMTRLLIRSKPKTFEDIIACIALYRPGPLESGMTEEYVKRKNGEVPVVFPHDSLKPVLKDTFGTMVYQEQVMIISQVIGGFSMAEADTLRKAMGKKKMDVMDKLKQKFVDQACERGHKEKWAGELFDMMSEFGKYGFNKSHSAAYGLITYQTAYLKSHYPVEFMKATLDSDIENTEKLIGFIHESRLMGIEILPPDVNESSRFFTIIGDNTIRYGLLGLKGLGQAAVDAIVEAREEKPFADILDFASRVEHKHLNKKLLEALIFCGAFDAMGYSRAGLIEVMEDIIAYGSSLQKDKSSGQSALFGAEDLTGGAVIKVPEIDEWDDKKRLQLERQTLGLYLTSHPMDKYTNILGHSSITPLIEIDDGISPERFVTLAGVIEGVKTITTKRGSTFLSIALSDLSGQSEIRVFEKTAAAAAGLLQENEIVVIEAKVTIYRDSDTPTISITANKIEPAAKIDDKIDKVLHLNIGEIDLENFHAIIPELKKTLRKHRGSSPVLFHYKNRSGEFEAPIKPHFSYYVEYSDDLNAELGRLLGSDSFVVWQIADELRYSNTLIA